MPTLETTSAAEYHSYRRFVTWFVLSFVALGSIYLLASVGVSIYRRRHAVPTGDKVSKPLSIGAVRSCFEELDDVRLGLEKHLENFHTLLAGYDPGVAGRWADEGRVWRGQWKELGRRCRFSEIPGRTLRKEFEGMATAYEELGDTEQVYTSALLRFGMEQAPRLDRVRARLKLIDERLARAQAKEGKRP